MIHHSTEPDTSSIPSRYYHIARNMRGRYYSSDAIRRVLIRRGLSWEKSFVIIEQLEREDSSRNPVHPFTPRNRLQALKRIRLSALALGLGCLPVMLDAIGLEFGLFSSLGLVMMIISTFALIIYTVGYMLFWL